ncbi:hypothetical protein [Pseudomonas sp. SED1]|uniref:hypothetical protein n=1 Tax=Pseudomonas sp. SED1 TaxID=3056845 RepID=UPI00296E8492|nr:hypothetical protein [Pseudomonas sp. SED1]MDY0836541.1 hypothetical protein [Pseudomonas sp. SED1]
MTISSSKATQIDGHGFEIFNTSYHGKNLQVVLVWSLGGIEASFPPGTAISHMLYINEENSIVDDVTKALDVADPGDCLMLLCANHVVSSGVRSFLRPVA